MDTPGKEEVQFVKMNYSGLFSVLLNVNKKHH